jgi:hypothetical protein
MCVCSDIGACIGSYLDKCTNLFRSVLQAGKAIRWRNDAARNHDSDKVSSLAKFLPRSAETLIRSVSDTTMTTDVPTAPACAILGVPRIAEIAVAAGL